MMRFIKKGRETYEDRISKRMITPAPPVLLAGYEGVREASGVLDDLYVRVCIFEKYNMYYGVIQYDLLAVDSLIINAVKKKMMDLGLYLDHFVMAASHTHSGPGGIVDTGNLLKGMENVFQKTDKERIEFIAEKTNAALIDSLADLSEGKLSVAEGEIEGIGNNRKDRDLKGSDNIFVFYIHKKNGEKAAIVNFACHPTILDAANHKISADFPGAIERYLRKKGYRLSMFLNGSSGDISTRFTRTDSTYQEVERIGGVIGEKVEDLSHAACEMDIKRLFGRTFSFPLKIKKADELSEAKSYMDYLEDQVVNARRKGISGGELRKVESRYEGARAAYFYAMHPIPFDTIDVSITVFKINDLFFIMLPGELFSELSNKLEDENIRFISYANGYTGYLADKDAYKKLYYEALISPFAQGEGEKMMERLEDVIENWRG